MGTRDVLLQGFLMAPNLRTQEDKPMNIAWILALCALHVEGDATVKIRNVDTGATLQEFKSEDAVTSICLSGDGKTLSTVEKTGSESQSRNRIQWIVKRHSRLPQK